MILTITLIIGFLVVVNFLLLLFSSNKTNVKSKVSKPPVIIRNAESYNLPRGSALALGSN